MLCIVAPNITSRFKRRPIYLACCATVCMGTLTLSSYCYFNQNNQLVNQFPVTRWIPILAIVICYTGFSFGYGSVVYILQVNSFQKYFVIYFKNRYLPTYQTCTFVEKCNNFWWTLISIPYFSVGVNFTYKQKCIHSSWTLQEFTPTVKKRDWNLSPSIVVTYIGTFPNVGICIWCI